MADETEVVEEVTGHTEEEMAEALYGDKEESAQEEQPVEATEEKEAEATEEETSQEDKDGESDESQKEGAPESYEDFTLPEGMAVDDDTVSTFKEVAKELNLSQENAQKLVDLQTGLMQKVFTAQRSEWDNLQKDWVEKAKTDEEIGGHDFSEKMAVARKALDAFGTDELKAVLDTTGTGNNPEVLRFFYKVGQQLSEDTFRKGNVGEDLSPEEAAKSLYPNSPELN